jgi:hypothetical protein
VKLTIRVYLELRLRIHLISYIIHVALLDYAEGKTDKKFNDEYTFIFKPLTIQISIANFINFLTILEN